MSPRAFTFREILRDSVVLLLAGIAVGLVANGISPRGLSLRRDYFAGLNRPGAGHATSESRAASFARAPAVASESTGINAARRVRLAARGIDLADHARAVELFRDGDYVAGRIVFIDARDDVHFKAGHIRGAWQLDHYRLEQHLTEILGACAIAERIVVYCNGGECEDSELAANDLLQFGVPATKLLVYAGGITEWTSQGMPIETGSRASGQSLP